MNNYDVITEMSLEELAIWLGKIDSWEDTPWVKWWDKNYCSNCKPLVTPIRPDIEHSFCELKHHCKFASSKKELTDVDIITTWLEAQSK